jgi:hypothetical protein
MSLTERNKIGRQKWSTATPLRLQFDLMIKIQESIGCLQMYQQN